MTRAAIYARYSSHHQRDESIEIQVENSEAYCRSKGYTVVGTYADRATSGTTANRAEFARMIEDARRGVFDVVVVWKASRIMRNRDEMALVRLKLRQLGVEIEYAGESLPEGPSGDLMLAMLEAMAEYESALLGERIRDGMRKSAERGLAAGVRLFGYDVDPEGRFQVNDAEAAAIREAFAMCAAGSTMADIARSLDGFRTRRGGRFRIQTVKDMLQKQQYRGVYSFAGVTIEGGMPRIVEDELWWTVQERLEGDGMPKKRKKHDYALTGKLRHSCGGAMVGVSGKGRNGKHTYYRCKECRKTVRQDVVEGAVRSALLAAFADNDVRERIADIFMEGLEIDAQESRPDALRAELADVRARIGRIWDAIESGAPGGLERLEGLKEREAALEADIARCSPMDGLGRKDVLEFLDYMSEASTDAMAAPFVSSVVWDGESVHCCFVFDGEPPEPPPGVDGSDSVGSGSPGWSLGEPLRMAYPVRGGMVLVAACRR